MRHADPGGMPLLLPRQSRRIDRLHDVALEAEPGRLEQVNEALRGSDLDETQRMAVRHSLHMRRQVRASGHDALDGRLTALHEQLRRLRRL